MKLEFRKKSGRDRIINLKSFEMQKVKEMGWKKPMELRGFPILWVRILQEIFQVEGKECKDQETLKM